MTPGNDLKARVEYFADWDYNIKVAGVSFRQRELDELYEADWNQVQIELQEDPDNEVDPNAIKILASVKHIGYIPALVAPYIKDLLNNGEQFECALIYVTDGKRGKGIRTAKIAARRK